MKGRRNHYRGIVMPVAYRKLSTAALGVTLLTLGTVLSPMASAAAAPQATLSLSSPAAGARGVTYAVQFTPAATLSAGSGKLTLTAPKGTRLPAAISDVFDVTASQDLGAVTGGKLSAAGATATWTVGAALPGGHLIDLTLPGAANPPAGTYSLHIATSAQKATIATAAYHVILPRAVRSPVVSFAEPVVAQQFAPDTYPVRFTTSPSGALVAGHGTITLTAAKGTILPFAIGDMYDATTGTDLGPLSGGVLTDNGAAGTWKVAKTIPAGHVIYLRLDGVTEPKAGSYRLAIVTSSDTVTASAPYTVFAVDSPLQISGFTGVAPAVVDEGDDNFGPATVQTCSPTACVTSQSDTDPLSHSGFTLFVPSPGEYTITAYPAATDTGVIGQQTIGPLFVSGKVRYGDQNQADLDLQPVSPEPAGVTFDGQSATIPSVYWDSPAPLSVPGCAGGAGVAAVSGFDPSTGTPDVELARLTESPAGSGTYTATVPAQYPAHGTMTITPQTACSPPTALLPPAGPAGGGNEVQLSGQGFTGATAVLFGGKPAKSFTVASDTLIDAVAPAGSGTVGISVVTPSGTIFSSSLSQYRYLSVGTVFPASGPAKGGQTVTLTGSGFSGIQAVYFGNKTAGNVDVVSATQITATVPAGKPGKTVPVTILTDDGGQTVGTVTFTYWNPAAAPAVPAPGKAASAAVTGGRTAVAPASPSLPSAVRTASAAGPAVFTGGFAAVDPFAEQLGVAADLVRKMAGSCAGTGGAAAFATALSGAFARVAGKLSNPRGWVGAAGGLTGSAAAFLSSALELPPFHGGLQPLLDLGFTVPELIAVGSMLAAVDGLVRHGASQSVLSADLKCAEVILYPVISNTMASAGFTVRAIPPGTVVDTNGNPVPGATVTLLQAPDLAQPFSVVAAATPGVEPQENPQTTDSNGTFGWDLIGGRYEIEASKPGCTAPGNPGQTVVTSPAFRGLPPTTGLVLTLSCPGEAPPSAPAVTGLSTASGPTAGGTQVDVQGTGFTGSLAVTFGSRKAAVTVLSPTELAATAPAGTGTVDVRVRTAAGMSTASGADRYTYRAAPAVTRISPASGPAKGGTAVTVTGTRFAAGDQVTFGSALAEEVTVASATRIVAMSPAGLGLAAVTVSSPVGVSKPVTAGVFKFLLKPSFTSAAKATAVQGKAFRFTVRTTGYPVPSLSWTGVLPRGLRIAAGKGTLVISGTPAAAGRFALHLHARNSLGTAGQTLTIIVKT